MVVRGRWKMAATTWASSALFAKQLSRLVVVARHLPGTLIAQTEPLPGKRIEAY